MYKGQSYITISDTTHPKHKLVKALTDKGYSSFVLIYASHMATDAGWTTISTNLPYWLGYTIKESLRVVNALPTKKLISNKKIDSHY